MITFKLANLSLLEVRPFLASNVRIKFVTFVVTNEGMKKDYYLSVIQYKALELWFTVFQLTSNFGFLNL